MAVFTISDQYKYKGQGPFDAKSLVKTYSDLTLQSTWLVDNKLVAYNGMLVSVGLNKTDPSKNGVYVLFDPSVTTALGKPDVTNENNWHKLAELTDFSDIVAKIASNTQAITAETAARIAAISAIYTPSVGETPATGLLVEEITRASVAEQAIAETLATLIGADSGKAVREITAEEIAKIVDTGNQTVSAYVSDQIAKLIQFKASTEITIDEDGTLGLGEVSTDKLVQGTQTLVFNGGYAK